MKICLMIAAVIGIAVATAGAGIMWQFFAAQGAPADAAVARFGYAMEASLLGLLIFTVAVGFLAACQEIRG